MWGWLESDTCTASHSVPKWDLTPECSSVDKEDKGSICVESLLWTRLAATAPSLRRGGVLLFNQSSLTQLSSSGAKVRPLLVLIKMNRRGLIGVIEAYLRLQLCRHEMWNEGGRRQKITHLSYSSETRETSKSSDHTVYFFKWTVFCSSGPPELEPSQIPTNVCCHIHLTSDPPPPQLGEFHSWMCNIQHIPNAFFQLTSCNFLWKLHDVRSKNCDAAF